MSLAHYGSLRAVVLQGDIWHAVRETWLGGRRKQGRFLGHLDRAFIDGREKARHDKGFEPFLPVEHDTWG